MNNEILGRIIKMKRQLLRLQAFVLVTITFLCMIPQSVKAASKTDSKTLAGFGFTVDSKTYTKTSSCKMYSNYLFVDDESNRVITMTTRVWVCRQKGTYKDVILTWTELDPESYKNKNKLGIKTKYKAYPESLTVNSTFPSSVEYLTSAPKSQAVSSKYSVGANAAVSDQGINAGVSGSVDIEIDALTLKNQSSSGKNKFKVVYDYKPGLTTLSKNFDYLRSTTEQIGSVYVKSDKKNYTFTMNFTANVGYTCGPFIYNGSHCEKLKQSRTITTNF